MWQLLVVHRCVNGACLGLHGKVLLVAGGCRGGVCGQSPAAAPCHSRGCFKFAFSSYCSSLLVLVNI